MKVIIVSPLIVFLYYFCQPEIITLFFAHYCHREELCNINCLYQRIQNYIQVGNVFHSAPPTIPADSIESRMLNNTLRAEFPSYRMLSSSFYLFETNLLL